jgi:hypothetical protein
MPVVVFDRALEAGEALIASLGRGAAVGGDVNNDADVTAAIEAATERARSASSSTLPVVAPGAGHCPGTTRQ